MERYRSCAFFSVVMQKQHGSSRRSRRLAGDRENRHVIAFGVIEAGDERSGAALQCREHAVDAIARLAENAPHAPFMQPADKEIANGAAHGRLALF